MKKVLFAAVAAVFVWAATAPVYADSVTTEFTQNIGTGTLSVTILDHTEATVGAPAVPLAGVNTHALCNTTDATGSLGTNAQRVYVDNPGAANDGWGLAIAATDGPTAKWSSGSNHYDFNDAESGGCGDGSDTDNLAGQMTIDPSGATLTLSCSGLCTSTGVSMGVQDAFEEGSVNSISLATAAANSDDIWRGHLTSIDVLQTIPATQPAGNYTIDMTLTVTAL